jgi:hypothetical protein
MRSSLRQVLFRSAGLDLNFAGGVFSLNNTRTSNPANIPGWSFSRTDTNGTATALDLAGNVIQFPSRTNLLLQSQTFDDAGWTKGGSTVTANATAAPDESITADKLVEDTSTGLHRLSQIVAKAASATTYTFTVFAKASERTQLRLALDDVGANNGGATFDLSNGTISTAAAVTGDFTNASASITAVGSWYRLALTVTSNTVTSIRAQTQIAVSGSISYTGVAGSGLFLWGAQLETGSTATAYIPTTTAAVTVTPPRITNRGILVEEARTNLLINSSGTGATGSTPPTGWNLNQSFGSISPSSYAVATGTDSSPGVSFCINGTTSNTNQLLLSFTSSRVAVTAGSTYAVSYGVSRVAGTFAAQVSIAVLWYNAIGGLISATSTTAQTPTTTTTRYSQQVTAPALATTANVRFETTGTLTSPTAYDFTLFIGAPQFELGAFATSPIITTGAAGTRGVDAASIVLPSNVSSFAATYNSGTTATGAVTPGATFDLVTARAWLNGYLQRFRVT